MLKLTNPFYQVMSHTDKKRYFLIFKFKLLFLKMLRLKTFCTSGSNLINSMMTDRNKIFQSIVFLTLKFGAVFVEYTLRNFETI